MTKPDYERIDRFADMLAQGKSIPRIRVDMNLSKGAAQGIMSRLRKSLGPQAV